MALKREWDEFVPTIRSNLAKIALVEPEKDKLGIVARLLGGYVCCVWAKRGNWCPREIEPREYAKELGDVATSLAAFVGSDIGRADAATSFRTFIAQHPGVRVEGGEPTFIPGIYLAGLFANVAKERVASVHERLYARGYLEGMDPKHLEVTTQIVADLHDRTAHASTILGGADGMTTVLAALIELTNVCVQVGILPGERD